MGGDADAHAALNNGQQAPSLERERRQLVYSW
jgi:hypothetical protein